MARGTACPPPASPPAESAVDDGLGHDDNERVLAYLAKYTAEPAIVHGIAGEVGSLAPGRLADIVLWEPAMFGVRPSMVIKGGVVAWSAMGEGKRQRARRGADRLRPRLGGTGEAAARLSTTFVARAAVDAGIAADAGHAPPDRGRQRHSWPHPRRSRGQHRGARGPRLPR